MRPRRAAFNRGPRATILSGAPSPDEAAPRTDGTCSKPASYLLPPPRSGRRPRRGVRGLPGLRPLGAALPRLAAHGRLICRERAMAGRHGLRGRCGRPVWCRSRPGAPRRAPAPGPPGPRPGRLFDQMIVRRSSPSSGNTATAEAPAWSGCAWVAEPVATRSPARRPIPRRDRKFASQTSTSSGSLRQSPS